jgi:hypothetical protein
MYWEWAKKGAEQGCLGLRQEAGLSPEEDGGLGRAGNFQLAIGRVGRGRAGGWSERRASGPRAYGPMSGRSDGPMGPRWVAHSWAHRGGQSCPLRKAQPE